MRKILLFILSVLCLSTEAQTIDGRNFNIDGFAALDGISNTKHYLAGGTTGGKGGKVVYANDFQQLQAYLQSTRPYIILVDHDINSGIKCYVESLSTGALCDKQDGSEGVESFYGERVYVASNKTLIGIKNKETGEAPLFSRITFVLQSVNNIIIRNCRFTMNGVPILKNGENKIVAFRNGKQVEVGDPDCIGIQADVTDKNTDWGAHIWIDHCEFFNGDAANKDRYDGLLDCKNNVQWLTFSYNKFHNHDKSCLFGKGDNDVYDNCRTISFHHNAFINIQGSRLPLQRGGHMHFCNNYMENCKDGWDMRTQSVGYIEGCYFKDTKNPIYPREGELNINKMKEFDIVYDNCNRIISGYSDISGRKKFDKEYVLNATSTWLPTSYDASYHINNIDKSNDLPEIIKKYTGAGMIEIYKAYSETIPVEDLNEVKEAEKTVTKRL